MALVMRGDCVSAWRDGRKRAVESATVSVRLWRGLSVSVDDQAQAREAMGCCV